MTAIDLTHPVQIADGVYWIGQPESAEGLRSNPFVIVDGNDAIVIESGSRPDFGAVLMRIMQVGLAPSAISTLIYQQHDPDHCGSAAYFEEIIGRPDLRIISSRESSAYIRAFGVKTAPSCIEDLGYRLALASGRTLRFLATPFALAAGSFMTFDQQSSVLFTSDLLGACDAPGERELFGELSDACRQCTAPMPARGVACPNTNALCAVRSIVDGHRRRMPSNPALQRACRTVLESPARVIAPQHGWIWRRRDDVDHIVRRLMATEDIGADRVNETIA